MRFTEEERYCRKALMELRWLIFAILSLFAVGSLTSCNGTGEIQGSLGNADENSCPAPSDPGPGYNSLLFSGITSITDIGGTQAKISWNPVAGAKGYHVFDVTEASNPKLLKTIPSTESYAIVTGLNTNSTYKFRVRVLDNEGRFDNNTEDTLATTATTSIPFDVNGLNKWVKADGLSGKNDGDLVDSWNDLSGNATHATQSTPALQPLYKTNQINSLPALSFDGADDYLLFPNSSVLNSFTVFLVAQANLSHEIDPETNSGSGSGTANQKYVIGPKNGGNDAHSGLSMGTNGLSVYEHANFYMPALAVYSSAIGSGFVLVTIRYTSRTPELFLGGTLVRNGLTSGKTAVYSPVILGGYPSFGHFDGMIAEFLVYDSSLSDTDREKIESYLKTKYNLL